MQEDPQITYPDPGFWTKTSLLQLFYGVMVNLTSVTTGLAYSFTALLIPQLLAEDSKIHCTVSDETWIVSILPLAILVGNISGGTLMDRYGRRFVLTLCQVPMSIGWLTIGSANSVKQLIIGRVVVGIGAGMGMGPPRAYVTEIALPNMRGVICSLPNLGVAVGISLQAALGTFMKWYHLAHFNGIYSVILFFLSFIFPETPYFVLMKDTEENTERALRKFRSETYNIAGEMEQLLDFKHDNHIRFGSFVALFSLGLFLKSHDQTSAVPIFLFMLFVMFASFGYYPLPVLVLFELSPLQIRGLLGGITIATVNISIFTVNKVFLALQTGLGFGNMILCFGVVSFIATVYIYFFLPETKELTLQEIEEFYNDRRPTLTSQRRIVSMQALSRRAASMESRSLMKLKPTEKC
ncbi:facilitated trehalose transporter Tret1-like [Battus philenor]|uniref:facilitated trehalose transporter Tret1-like n=1 Tax=Battus philenor TaxID=42288 RepID=UPI0035CEDF7B